MTNGPQPSNSKDSLSLICHREDYQTLKLKEPLKTCVIPLAYTLKNQGPGAVSMACPNSHSSLLAQLGLDPKSSDSFLYTSIQTSSPAAPTTQPPSSMCVCVCVCVCKVGGGGCQTLPSYFKMNVSHMCHMKQTYLQKSSTVVQFSKIKGKEYKLCSVS